MFNSETFISNNNFNNFSERKRRREPEDTSLITVKDLLLENNIMIFNDPFSLNVPNTQDLVNCTFYLKMTCGYPQELIEKILSQMKLYELSERQYPQFLNLLVDLNQMINLNVTSDVSKLLEFVSQLCNGSFNQDNENSLKIKKEFKKFLTRKKLDMYLLNLNRKSYEFIMVLTKDLFWANFWEIISMLPQEERPLSFVQEQVQKHINSDWDICLFHYIDVNNKASIDVMKWLISKVTSIEKIYDDDTGDNILFMIIDSDHSYEEEYVLCSFKKIFKHDKKIVLDMIFYVNPFEYTLLEHMACENYFDKVWDFVIDFIKIYDEENPGFLKERQSYFKIILDILEKGGFAEKKSKLINTLLIL